ncbi:MAG: putative ABC transport system permease protein [Planctomycetota bacterium]|jgi:putative ABC transport system permease protein
MRLAWQRLCHERGLTLVLVACIALPLFLPLAARVLSSSYEGELVERAEATPLVFGARGSRFDLVLGTLYLRPTNVPTVPWSALRELTPGGEGVAIPLHLRFSARGRPLVGTSPEYYELRSLQTARGTLPLFVGDCVVGADLAQELGVEVGDTLFSDPTELYDIAKPPALEMTVVGVLARAGGPEDDAVLVDVKTTWVLEGLLHGHADALTEVDESLILGRTEDSVVLNQALMEKQRVTTDNIGGFHGHGDPDLAPLSAIIFLPRDEKAATLVSTRVEVGGVHRLVSARAVVDELFAIVLRLRDFLDRLSLLIALSTAVLTGLVVGLSIRIRSKELQTLQRIGIARGTVAGLLAAEVLIVLLGSACVALIGSLLLGAYLPDIEALLAAR